MEPGFPFLMSSSLRESVRMTLQRFTWMTGDLPSRQAVKAKGRV
jgi:hypothetical protein